MKVYKKDGDVSKITFRHTACLILNEKVFKVS